MSELVNAVTRTYLKTLKLKGFKSFAKATLISFSPFISAIVGPNGCGKSNIVDAIKWVLGEQGYKPLRSKTAEDLIFSGTTNYKQASMAEVSLVFERPQNPLPQEVMVTRRVFRSGEGNYLLNKRICRLKDIKEMLLDIGISSKSYAIIDQGQVTSLIEFSPLEKRCLLEETAGIAKYRQRREETYQKIEETKQNLQRIEDILKEVETQTRKLASQAKKARQYMDLKKALKDIEITLIFQQYQEKKESLEKIKTQTRALFQEIELLEKGHLELIKSLKDIEPQTEFLNRKINSKEKELLEIQVQIKETKLRLKALLEKVESYKRQKTVLEKKGQALELERTRVEEGRKKIGEEIGTIEFKTKQFENEVEKAKSLLIQIKASLEKQIPELKAKQRQKDEGKKDLIKIESELDYIKRQEKRIDQEYIQKAAKLNKLLKEKQIKEGELERISQCLREKEYQKANLKGRKEVIVKEIDKLFDKISRWNKAIINLEESLTRFKSQLKTTRFWLKNHQPQSRPSQTLGQVFDMIEDASGVESAVEAVLEYKTKGGWLIKDFKEALKISQEESFSLIPLNFPFSLNQTKSEIGCPLMQRIKVRPQFESVAQRIFSNVILIEEISLEFLPSSFIYVTPKGQLLTPEGILYWSQTSGILKEYLKQKALQKRLQGLVLGFDKRLSQIKMIFSKFKERHSEQERFLKEVFKEINCIEGELRHLRERRIKESEFLKYAGFQISELEKRITGIKIEREKLLRLREELLQRQGILKTQNYELSQEINKIRQKIDKIELIKRQKEELLRRYEWQNKEMHEKREFLLKESQRLELRQTEIEKELEQIISDLSEIENFLKHVSLEQDRLKRDMTQFSQRAEEIQGEIELAQNQLSKVSDQKKKLAQEAQVLKAKIEDKKNQIQLLERQIAGLKAEKEIFRSRLLKDYQLDPEEISIECQGLNKKELEAQRKSLQTQLERLGHVNLSAIEEYEEIRQRYEFLKTQKQDLINSIKGLQRAISEIDQTSTKLFLATLQVANEQFQKLLQFVFGEAQGEIYLTDPSHPLSSGVDFKVKLPGKKVRHHLFSMGERSLISLAFLFGLYFVKPSPFCVLDEVDAGLDERNVERFCNLLRRLKEAMQLIVISHHRRVMEEADRLIGVTMEQKGVTNIISISLSGEGNVQVV